jgi:hypothetical protein
MLGFSESLCCLYVYFLACGFSYCSWFAHLLLAGWLKSFVGFTVYLPYMYLLLVETIFSIDCMGIFGWAIPGVPTTWNVIAAAWLMACQTPFIVSVCGYSGVIALFSVPLLSVLYLAYSFPAL